MRTFLFVTLVVCLLVSGCASRQPRYDIVRDDVFSIDGFPQVTVDPSYELLQCEEWNKGDGNMEICEFAKTISHVTTYRYLLHIGAEHSPDTERELLKREDLLVNGCQFYLFGYTVMGKNATLMVGKPLGEGKILNLNMGIPGEAFPVLQDEAIAQELIQQLEQAVSFVCP